MYIEIQRNHKSFFIVVGSIEELNHYLCKQTHFDCIDLPMPWQTPVRFQRPIGLPHWAISLMDLYSPPPDKKDHELLSPQLVFSR